MRTISSHDLLSNCPWCDYALEGLPVKHCCPECGHAFDRGLKLLGGAPLWTRMNRQRKWAAVVSLAGTVALLVHLLRPGPGGLNALTVAPAAFVLGSVFWAWYCSNMRASPQFILAGPEGIQVWDRKSGSIERCSWETFTEAEARDGGVKVTIQDREVVVYAFRAESKAFAELLNEYKDDWEYEQRAASAPDA